MLFTLAGIFVGDICAQSSDNAQTVQTPPTPLNNAEERAISWINDIKSGDRGMQQRAQAEVQFLGPQDAELVPTLIKYLNDQDLVVRFYTVRALGKIGPSANGAISELISAYQKESDLDIRVNMVWAIAEIEGANDSRVIPVFTMALSEKDMIRTNIFTGQNEESPTATERSRSCALVGLKRLKLNSGDIAKYPDLIIAIKSNVGYRNRDVSDASEDLLSDLLELTNASTNSSVVITNSPILKH